MPETTKLPPELEGVEVDLSLISENKGDLPFFIQKAILGYLHGQIDTGQVARVIIESLDKNVPISRFLSKLEAGIHAFAQNVLPEFEFRDFAPELSLHGKARVLFTDISRKLVDELVTGVVQADVKGLILPVLRGHKFEVGDATYDTDGTYMEVAFLRDDH